MAPPAAQYDGPAWAVKAERSLPIRFGSSPDAEAVLHAERGVRVALVRVAAGLEGHGPRLRAHERKAGFLADAARAEQVEVVDRPLVLDLDRVLAGLQRLHVLAGLLEFDRVAGPDGALELPGRR